MGEDRGIAKQVKYLEERVEGQADRIRELERREASLIDRVLAGRAEIHRPDDPVPGIPPPVLLNGEVLDVGDDDDGDGYSSPRVTLRVDEATAKAAAALLYRRARVEIRAAEEGGRDHE